MFVKKFCLIIALLLSVLTQVCAQTKTVTGVVTDKQTGEPLIGVSVAVKGTTRGSITDLDGKFSIPNVSVGEVLSISYVGYTTQEMEVKAGTAHYVVALAEDAEVLDEVVVVGFGTQRRANLTEAVATVDTKVLKSRPVTNLGQSLQGTVPGLNLSVGAYGGQLGQTMDINIRGTGTISTGSTASTLVLIDGIEGNMNNLNPDDIESISVLKDAAASSIYGSRAAFGVVLITTKKGKVGSTVRVRPLVSC